MPFGIKWNFNSTQRTRGVMIFCFLFFALTGKATCQPGQMTHLIQPIQVIPCGQFDRKEKKCTDTTKTRLGIGTSVHVVAVDTSQIEVYVGYISDLKNQKRYINQFVPVSASDSKNRLLACQ